MTTIASAKKIPVVGTGLQVVSLGYTAFKILSNDDLSCLEKTADLVRTAATTAVGIGAGVAGLEVGGAIGTAICPGVGTVIGGFLGGLVYGLAGGLVSRQLFERKPFVIAKI